MRDIWEEQLNWINSGEPFVLARVIRTWRSAPRKTGAGMLIGPGMKVAGSVSGGCIEGAVIEEALEVLETGTPRQLDYGVEDDLALSVGLSCGGAGFCLCFRVGIRTRLWISYGTKTR